ncbi:MULTISPECIES: hypothetical protein [Paraburkholderia]|uniref:hypothetical protein n=1 Tax=Paraburkholderia TaxID=1822464 RepID=UPI002AB2F79D|nr:MULTISPECIES: hypothetical protein [Paraburkholderia]
MEPKIPGGFHQALVSATVFLSGTTLAYLKFFVVDASSQRWSLFAAISALIAFCAMILQAATLYRALQIENDNPRTFSRTVGVLMSSMWCLIVSGLSLAVAQWWQPLPALTHWMNS